MTKSGKHHREAPRRSSRVPVFVALLSLLTLGGAFGYYYINHTETVDEAVSTFIDSLTGDDAEPEHPKDKKKGKGKKKRRKDKAGSRPSPDGSPESPPSHGEDIATPARPARPAADLRRGLDEARRHFADLEYDKTVGLLDGLLQGPVPPAFREEARPLLDKARSFAEVVKGIKPLELSSLEGIVMVHLTNGNTMRGRVLKKTSRKVVFQKDKGIKAHLPRDEIVRMVPLSRREAEKLEMEKLDKYAAEIRQADSRRSRPLGKALRQFLLARFCMEHGLFDQVNRYLDKGRTLDPLFAQNVYNLKARKLYERYLYFKGKNIARWARISLETLMKTYPDSYYTRQAREDEKMPAPARVEKRPRPKPAAPAKDRPRRPATEPKAPPRNPLESPEEDPWGEDEPEPSRPSGNPAKNPLIAKAKRWIAQGERHEERSMPGEPNADEETKKAVLAFEKAIEILEEAMEKHPELESWIDNKISAVSAKLYWCRKRQKIN